MVVEAAIAAAARQAGYPGFAELISDERLNLQVVASRFRRFSLAGDKGRTLALILAAGRVARYRENPAAGWDRDLEEAIIKQALAEPRVLLRGKLTSFNQDTPRAFARVTDEAARIVTAFFS